MIMTQEASFIIDFRGNELGETAVVYEELDFCESQFPNLQLAKFTYCRL